MQSLGGKTFELQSKIGTYMLPNSPSYEGHCFRLSSTYLLADTGARITDINVAKHQVQLKIN